MRFTLKHLCSWAAVLLFAAPAVAQVAPAATGGGYGIHVFGEYSFGFPNYNAEYLKGVTAGAFLQRSRWIGGELRGAALQWGPSNLHQSSILIGPRIQYPAWRFTPYAAFEPGITHVVLPIDGIPGLPLSGVNKFAWQIIGGVDFRVSHRWSVRAGEMSYGKIYYLNGLNPKSFSAGVVYRLF